MSKQLSEVNSLEEFHDVIRTGESVLVDYYADWCGPCRALAPNLERIASANAGSLRVIKVNIDATPELADRARIGEIPALHFYRDARKVGVLTGFRTDVALTKALQRYGMITEPGTVTPLPKNEAHEGDRRSLVDRILSVVRRPRDPNAPAPDSPATSFHFIESEQDLVDVIERSRHDTTPLFLHDPTCSISARAFRQMEKLGSDLPTLDVSRHHSLSEEVERRTGVRHQSPQVIVLHDASAVWNAGHGKVKASSVRAAIAERSRNVLS